LFNARIQPPADASDKPRFNRSSIMKATLRRVGWK
jgi:hypothetical protein